MPQKFRPGDQVKQKMPAPVTGTVIAFDLDQTTGDVQFQVAWKAKDETGVEHAHSRFFNEEQLESAGTPEPVAGVTP